MTSYARSFLTLNAHQKPTVGDTKMSVIQDDHMGWLLCDGREIDINTFYFLYQVIGNAYGSAATGKFKLPNASGRVPGFVGLSDEKTWVLGDVSGEENHVLTIAQMPSHNHGGVTDLSATRITIDASGVHRHTYLGVTDQSAGTTGSTSVAENDPRPTENTSFEGLHSHSITDPQHRHGIQSQGGDQPHNNMQPTIFIGNMFIYTGKPTYGKYPLPMPQTSPYPIL